MTRTYIIAITLLAVGALNLLPSPNWAILALLTGVALVVGGAGE